MRLHLTFFLSLRHTLLPVCAALAGCGQAITGATDSPVYDAFGAPSCIQIAGYDDDAMEPFISPDGQILMFNNRNSPPERTDLHWARRIDETRFEYAGTITGANSTDLDGVPSMDRHGRFYFVSTRDYAESLSTLYEAQWSNGSVTDVRLTNGVSRRTAGWVNFDAEISADGETLYFVDGRFSGGAVPDEADLVIAHKRGTEFERDPASASTFLSVNTAALEYAPAISADELELLFTRLDLNARVIGIYRATRPATDAPFGATSRVAAANGFVEAPALSGDGGTMFFHRLDQGRFHICRATRDARP